MFFLKDGRDITGDTKVVSGSAVITFSTVADITAVSGSALNGAKEVKYDLGAGTYVFTLYRKDEGNVRPIQLQSITKVATCDTKSYTKVEKAIDRLSPNFLLTA